MDRIVFRGNYELSAKELMDQVTVKRSHIWTHGSVSQKLLKQSANNIEALYRDRGYEEVKVKPQIVDREPKIDVAFDIEEGTQTVVEDVQVSGNQNISVRNNSLRPKDSNFGRECHFLRASWRKIEIVFRRPI